LVKSLDTELKTWYIHGGHGKDVSPTPWVGFRWRELDPAWLSG